jgi:DNA-binding response OmpR family regulator
LRKKDFGRNAILVALTGWGQEEHRRLSQFSGFDAHLTKPVDRESLARRVSALFEARTAAAHPPGPRLGMPPLVAVPEG